ncbi:MAG TPA: lytic transglycosylase domain-containing protein [Pyrinomonadaceae bacterium]|jgi:soluble lytic murein transglycosylase-like protein|nr:lytic transglycosylase domain-containing protein [Pyrinomonadaceae bacterium]
MPITRLFPRFQFFRNFSAALFALFILTNFADSPFTRVLAPVAAKTMAAEAEEFIPADIPSSGDRNLDLIILHAGQRNGVDPRLIHAVIWQESKYKPEAVSHAGAQGLMQLMPATAKRFKCDDRNDPAANVEAGTTYLRWLLKRFDGDVSLALAGYNAGEGNVDKHDGVPPFTETQNYVRIITGRYGKTYHPTLAPEDAVAFFGLKK